MLHCNLLGIYLYLFPYRVCLFILSKLGLLDPCLTLGTTIELGMMNQPVVYKLLATLRLSVDGHQDAACKIGRSGIIGRVVDWGANDSPPGIRAEATRLLAALFKHCHAKEVSLAKQILKYEIQPSFYIFQTLKTLYILFYFQIMKKIIECGGLPHIVFMLHSNHVVMLNEAIISLTIMASTFLQGYTDAELQTQYSSPTDVKPKEGAEEGTTEKIELSDPRTVSTQLHTDAVINGIKNCLKNPDHPKEVKANAATLTLTLLKTKTEEFKQMLLEMSFVTECFTKEAFEGLPVECKRLNDILNGK